MLVRASRAQSRTFSSSVQSLGQSPGATSTIGFRRTVRAVDTNDGKMETDYRPVFGFEFAMAVLFLI